MHQKQITKCMLQKKKKKGLSKLVISRFHEKRPKGVGTDETVIMKCLKFICAVCKFNNFIHGALIILSVDFISTDSIFILNEVNMRDV